MSQNSKPRAGEHSSDEQTIRLLAILVRQNTKNQTEAILELERAGFGPTRTAELLGTTPATVSAAIKEARKKPKPKNKQ